MLLDVVIQMIPIFDLLNPICIKNFNYITRIYVLRNLKLCLTRFKF